jgi:hypothetical protein
MIKWMGALLLILATTSAGFEAAKQPEGRGETADSAGTNKTACTHKQLIYRKGGE